MNFFSIFFQNFFSNFFKFFQKTYLNNNSPENLYTRFINFEVIFFNMYLFNSNNVLFKNFKKNYSINNKIYFYTVLFVYSLFLDIFCDLDFKVEIRVIK